jgi:hypothetical protein
LYHFLESFLVYNPEIAIMASKCQPLFFIRHYVAFCGWDNCHSHALKIIIFTILLAIGKCQDYSGKWAFSLLGTVLVFLEEVILQFAPTVG